MAQQIKLTFHGETVVAFSSHAAMFVTSVVRGVIERNIEDHQTVRVILVQYRESLVVMPVKMFTEVNELVGGRTRG